MLCTETLPNSPQYQPVINDHMPAESDIPSELNDDLIPENDREDSLITIDIFNKNVTRTKTPGEFFCIDKSKLLGVGSTSKVYAGQFKQTNQSIAIKVFHDEEDPSGFALSIINELLVYAHYRHPNIVRYHGTFFSRDTTYMAMELLDCSLHQLLSYSAYAGMFSEITHDQKIKMVADMLNGLVYLHSCGIIHRDIKPPNIFYNHDTRTMKIGDFGLSVNENMLCTSTRKIIMVVTPGYRALELLLGNRDYNNKIDVWSMAICIIYFLTHVNLARVYYTQPTQLELIHHFTQVFGPVTKESHPNVATFPLFNMYKHHLSRVNSCNRKLNTWCYSPQLYRLLFQKMLDIDFNTRCSSKQALEEFVSMDCKILINPFDI